MEKLIELYQQINRLHECTKMLCDVKWKSEESKCFNAGSEFAYKNVLKLICEKVGEENERKEIK